MPEEKIEKPAKFPLIIKKPAKFPLNKKLIKKTCKIPVNNKKNLQNSR